MTFNILSRRARRGIIKSQKAVTLTRGVSHKKEKDPPENITSAGLYYALNIRYQLSEIKHHT